MDTPIAAAPSATTTATGESQAPWASEVQRHLNWSIPFRFAFFLLIIPGVFAMAVWMRYYLLVTTILVALGLANFFNSITRLLAQYPKIRNVGPLGKALGMMISLHDFHLENRPFPFLYYIFYPITAPVMIFIRPAARSEAKLYFRVFLALMTGEILDVMFSYRSTYPPFLGISDALQIAVIHIVVSLLLATFCLMPVTSTAFTLSLSGRGKSLRWLTVASVLMAGLLTTGMILGTKETVSPRSMALLRLRMKKPAFREDILVPMHMMLTYLRTQLPKEKQLTDKPGVIPMPEPTARFRQTINASALNDEPKAFHIVAVAPAAGVPA